MKVILEQLSSGEDEVCIEKSEIGSRIDAVLLNGLRKGKKEDNENGRCD